MLNVDVDLSLLAPEIALLAVAIAVILADLVVERKGFLVWISIVGVAVSASLALGLWSTEATSFGGALVVDQFALFFKLLVLLTVFLVILSSQDYVSRFTGFVGEYYGLVLLAGVGMMLVAGARELITIYVSLELTSFSVIALAALLKESKSTESAIKYFLVSAVSSAIMLYGMALLFGLTGTTYLVSPPGADVPGIVDALTQASLLDNGALIVGFLFLITGFGFKIAAVPFQMWVPDVYEGAPTPVVAYLSVASKAAGFAVLLRVFLEAFPAFHADWTALFAILATVSMFAGNLIAMTQSNVKRLLGYSTIAHAGYLMIGVAAANELGQSGVLFYLAAYALTNMGAFMAIIALVNRVRSEDISSFAGLGRAAPFPAFILAFCLVSLTGVPPTAGFMGKVYLFNAAIQSGFVWLAVVGVINSVLSVYYYWKVIRIMYQERAYTRATFADSFSMRLSLSLAFLGVLLLGIAPQWVINRALDAVGVFQATTTAITSGL